MALLQRIIVCFFVSLALKWALFSGIYPQMFAMIICFAIMAVLYLIEDPHEVLLEWGDMAQELIIGGFLFWAFAITNEPDAIIADLLTGALGNFFV